MPLLLTIDQAAEQLGVKPGSLRTAAQRHGLLVKMGRAVRINPNDIPELIKSCQGKPKDRGCTVAATASGPSVIRAENSSQRALASAEKLKQRSRGTSPKKTDQPGQLRRIN